jgi:lysozyme
LTKKRRIELNVTDEGLALLRRLEGCRCRAYKDAAGVWTIGYGHTSMAGPPRVKSGMKISQAEADTILARDVANVARGVSALLDVPLSDGQFSALVSFAYNVGLENFRTSSVLRAVNSKDFTAVPRRLSLWVKAGGRVLPGLVSRRAAEAAMFVAATPSMAPASGEETGEARRDIEPLSGTPMRRSSTGFAAVLSGIAGVASSIAAGFGELAGAADGRLFAILAAVVIVAAALWIIRERRLKAREDGV